MTTFFCCCFGSRKNQIDSDRPQKHNTSEEINKRQHQNQKKNIAENENRINIYYNNIEDDQTQNVKCTENGFEKLQIQTQKYDNLIIFPNILFYYCGKSFQEGQHNNFKCEGELYRTEYDENINPKFTFLQGKFLVNLQNRSFDLKIDILPLEQPNSINEDNEKKSNQLMKVQNNNVQENNKGQIKIIDTDINEQVNIKHSGDNQQLSKQYQNLQQFCKFNQIISTNDMNILCQKGWMTSSIIDSYVLYLNKSGDEKYFKLQQKQRNTISRILFFPSSLTTNFGKDFNLEKVRELFEKEKPQFKQINFQLSLLYHYIGFPINNNNNHWLFLLFDLKSEKVLVFDSLYKKLVFETQISMIAQILNVKNEKKQVHQHSGQQKDTYSCGYRVCSLMKFYYNNQFLNKDIEKYTYNEQKIIDELKTLIKES